MNSGTVIKFDSPESEANYHRSRARRGRSAAEEAAPARPLPHSLEAEEYLLSCCLLDGVDVVERCIRAKVGPHSFYEPKHGMIFEVLLRLFAASKPIEVGTVAEEMKTARTLDAVGGYAFLTQVSSRIPTTAQASYFIEKVREQALLREMIRSATGVVEDCYNFSGGIDEFAGAVSAKIMAVTGPETGLPAMQTDDQLVAEHLPEPPMLIDKVAHVGGVCLLISGSKGSKTTTCMDMSIAVASGLPWLGFRTHQVDVLHIDFELPKWDLKKRGARLKDIRQIKDRLPITWWSLRGRSKPIEDLAPLIIARAPKGKFGLIVLEPAYKILGSRDENDNADVTDFMNWLCYIQEMTGAAVLCTHHMAKGDQGKKEAKDRASGAGAWVRAPDTAVVWSLLDEGQGEDCYKMEFIERSMKRHAPIGVQFEYPVFRLKSGLDLNALREAGRPRETTEKDVVKALGDLELTHGQWMKAVGVGREGQMSERTFNRRVKEAVDSGLVTQNGPLYRRARD